MAFLQTQNSQTPLGKKGIRYSPASRVTSCGFRWPKPGQFCRELGECFSLEKSKLLVRSKQCDFSNSVQGMTVEPDHTDQRQPFPRPSPTHAQAAWSCSTGLPALVEVEFPEPRPTELSFGEVCGGVMIGNC